MMRALILTSLALAVGCSSGGGTSGSTDGGAATGGTSSGGTGGSSGGSGGTSGGGGTSGSGGTSASGGAAGSGGSSASGGAAGGGGTSASGGSGGVSGSGGGGGVGPNDATCFAMASASACISCCSTNHAAWTMVADVTRQCVCTSPGTCASPCASDYCQSQGGSATCYACIFPTLAVGQPCYTVAKTTCGSDQDCNQYVECRAACTSLPN